MKKIYLLIAGILIIISVKGQKNFPMPSDNPFWTEEHGMLWSCGIPAPTGYCSGYYCACTMPVYYKSDTTINNLNYNRLYTRGICHAIYPYGMPPNGCPSSFSYQDPESLFATIRQDTLNKIVYILENNTETVLYDFKNIKAGQVYPQTYTNIQADTLVVVQEDSILLGNEYVKKWDLGIRYNGTITYSGFASIIEGVGSTLGILANLIPPFENSDYLQCFSMNNIVLYPDSNFNCDKTVNVAELSAITELSVFPKPAKDFLTITTGNVVKGKSFIRITSVTGVEMVKMEIEDSHTSVNISFLRKGVYFVQYTDGNTIETAKFIKD